VQHVGNKERILIVDDEDQIRSLLAHQLRTHGYDCATAGSPSEARRLLSAESFALVLSDVNMPGESGLDIAQEVLADYPDTAVRSKAASPQSPTSSTPLTSDRVYRKAFRPEEAGYRGRRSSDRRPASVHRRSALATLTTSSLAGLDADRTE